MRGLALILVLSGACRTHPAPHEAAPYETAREASGLELPADWDTRSSVAFERWIESALPAQAVTSLSPAAADELAAALDTPGERAVRAAVVLGRARTPRASQRLLAFLETRRVFEARAADAAAVVAARGLRNAADAPQLVPRLDALAVGALAHPDLEVRVECATAALDLGSPASIPFLLQVLRIDTPAGREDERDFAVPATSAWARGCAADALSRHAGLKNAYPTDGALAEREACTRRLERALDGTYESALK